MITKDRIAERCVIAASGCWVWIGATYPHNGYGCINDWHDGRNHLRRTHRLAYELWKEPIPDGMLVLHHCDNPPCCNPEHLFLGTQADNMRDRDAKGRTARGSANGRWVHGRFAQGRMG